MADSDPPDERPSLEMPSLSLRRRRATARTETSAAEPAPAPEPVAVEPVAVEPAAARRVPALPGAAAAALVGFVVGLAAVLLGVLLGAGCEAVRGTSACGGAIGLPALLASLVVLGWIGAVGLRLLGVGDAGPTSALAIGVAAVVVLVALLDTLDGPWAALALPSTGALAYSAARWVGTVVVEQGRSGSR